MNLNQFSIEAKRGDYYGAPSNPTLEVAHNTDDASVLVAGSVVKVASPVGKMIGVAKAGVEDVPFGVVIRSFNKAEYGAKEVLGIARAGDIIWMQSTEAEITAGSKVEFNADGLVLTSAGVNKVLGLALTSVPATGGLVAVEIEAPLAIAE